jgi:hypothetical protein
MAARPPRAKAKPEATKPPTARRPGLRLWSRAFQRWLIGGLLLAPLLALGIQLVREPDPLPEVASNVKPRVIAPLIAGSLANPQPTTLEFSLEEVNNHLAQVLQAGKKSDTDFVFGRAGVRFESEKCHFLSVYRWRGLDLHLNVSYSVGLQSGRVHVKPFSASLGRVRLGAFWIKKIEEGPFKKLQAALRKELVLLQRVEALRLEPSRVLMKVRASVPASGG